VNDGAQRFTSNPEIAGQCADAAKSAGCQVRRMWTADLRSRWLLLPEFTVPRPDTGDLLK